MRTTESFQDAYANGATPLVIDPNLPPAPPPSFVVAPTFELVDGQVLTVHGTGFSPDAQVAMVQCRAGADDSTGQACDLSKTLRFVTANDDGAFDTTFTVSRVLNTSMPWPYYAQMTDDELRAIWRFLQAVPARPTGSR